jgi:hypothetical protein
VSIEHVYSLIAEAERELKALAEKEKQQKETAKQDTYVFIFERRYPTENREAWDTDEWSPNKQCVMASSPGEAFQVFGNMVDMFSLTVRNVCYGTPQEMQSELDRVSRYWLDYGKKRRQAKEGE